MLCDVLLVRLFRDSSGPAATDLCWKAAWGWPHSCWLQYPERLVENISVLSLKCIKMEKWIWSIQSSAALFTRTVQCIEIFSFPELYQWKYNLSTFFCFPFITHNLCVVGLVLFHWLLWVYWLTEFGILNECVVQNQLCIWFWGFVVVLLSHPWCNWLGNTIRTKWSAASKLKLP